jgi:MoxR-like ATPase
MPVPTESELSRAVEMAAAVRAEIGRAVVGQESVLDEVVGAFFAGGHVLVEGVPGLGKTLIVLALARTFGGRSVRLQFTPDLMPSDVVGHTMFDVRTSEFRVRRGPAFTNLLLADEINRASAKTQAALLEVMQEGQITIEGTSFPLEPPFMTLATQNPIELEGTYPLPEAQLDRFLLKIRIGYPGEEEELRMLGAVTEGQVGERLDVSAVRQVATREEVLAVQRAAAGLTVDPRVTAYALRIVRASRTWPGIRVGAGPRGGIALVRIARARALMAGRDFVTPDDVKAGTLPALRHRIALAPDLEIEGRDADEVLSGLLEGVEAPRQ